KNATHEISLSDGVRTWGLRLDGGPGAIQEVPQTPSTIHMSAGGTKFGDWEPGYAHLEQRSWVGGRGWDDFSADRTRFFDSMMAYTLIDGMAFSAPQWHFAKGILESYENLPGDMGWQALTEGDRFAASILTVGASAFEAATLRFWVRRIGAPGTLTAEIWSDDGGGKPDAVFAGGSDSANTQVVKDVISVFHGFRYPGLANLGAGGKYHVVIYGAATDNAANHWEIGVDVDGGPGNRSRDGLMWSASPYGVYYRLEGAIPKRKFRFFEMESGLYAIDARADDTPSSIYMNGERGRATGGSTDGLTDSDKGMKGGWSDDEWNSWHIRIIAGKGKGQWRKIKDTSSSGLITVENAWDAIPNGSSDYVIYGGDAWQDITPATGSLIDVVVRDVAVFNRFATFALGQNYPVLFLRYNGGASPPKHETLDAPVDPRTKIDRLHVAIDPVDGPQLWLGRNTDMTVTRMSTFGWPSPPVVGDISQPISVGDDNYEITNITDFNGQVYVFKPDGLYSIANDRANELNIGLGFVLSENNGQALATHNSYQYFSWGGFSIQRLVGRDLASVGPDRGLGLPDDRKGQAAGLASHPAGLFASIDGGDENYSSVLVYQDGTLGWHEVFRGWDKGKRIQNLHWQVNPGTRPRLWIDIGGELVSQEWPQDASNPLMDAGMKYQHEAIIESASMDMGVSRLPKFIKELTLISEQLVDGVEVNLEYQLDGRINSGLWTHAGRFVKSPEDTLAIQRGDVKRIRYRLRSMTNKAEKTPVLLATVMEAFARTPLKYQWSLRVKVGDGQVNLAGGKDHDPDAFTRWLKNAARKAKRIHMRSIWEEMDDIYVIIEPPTLLRTFSNRLTGFWGGSQTLVIRDA
ncbi:MAG: hypothetical protein OEV06_06435, partial [Anaerolineae bacterium]|nr:hypothetical protein [Anaerolineae bacterium]